MLFLVILVVFSVVFSYGCAKSSSEINQGAQEERGQSAVQNQPAPEVQEQDMIVPEEVPVEEIAEPPAAPIEKVPAWKYGGQAIEGNYADSDFVALGNGKYRMYYAIEPEVPGNKLEVYSATSTDGIKWMSEAGVRRTFTVFPDVVKLPDGTWRMYFQNEDVIKSASSSDGLKWSDESGIRIDTQNNEGLTFENVAGPTTIVDGSRYIMIYSGAIPGKYKDAPNNRQAVLLWATSSDGLKFEVQGIALDSRNDNYYGWADTPDLIRWDDDTIKMFFWGYFGIYESTFTGEGFTEPVMVYEAKKENPMHRFPSSPPGDPTLGKIGEKWFMYYGQHTKGIYYATLEDEAEE